MIGIFVDKLKVTKTCQNNKIDKNPVNTLNTIQMSPSDTDAHDQEMMTTYRSNVSSIMYAAVHSRPDVTYSANLAA